MAFQLGLYCGLFEPILRSDKAHIVSRLGLYSSLILSGEASCGDSVAFFFPSTRLPHAIYMATTGCLSDADKKQGLGATLGQLLTLYLLYQITLRGRDRPQVPFPARQEPCEARRS